MNKCRRCGKTWTGNPREICLSCENELKRANRPAPDPLTLSAATGSRLRYKERLAQEDRQAYLEDAVIEAVEDEDWDRLRRLGFNEAQIQRVKDIISGKVRKREPKPKPKPQHFPKPGKPTVLPTVSKSDMLQGTWAKAAKLGLTVQELRRKMQESSHRKNRAVRQMMKPCPEPHPLQFVKKTPKANIFYCSICQTHRISVTKEDQP